jgi:hypothetical protein
MVKIKMKKLIPILLLLPTSISAQEVYSINVNRLCAELVGIPYASDNFSDEEWEQFKSCVNYVKDFQVK